jgi:hypothetical protein
MDKRTRLRDFAKDLIMTDTSPVPSGTTAIACLIVPVMLAYAGILNDKYGFVKGKVQLANGRGPSRETDGRLAFGAGLPWPDLRLQGQQPPMRQYDTARGIRC